MRALLPLFVAALVLQDPDPEIERDYLRTLDGSPLAMITLIAEREDGTPVRGYIQCAGWWYKHADESEETAQAIQLPFKTDSRGAIIMNPHVYDEWIYCWSESGEYTGSVRVEFSPESPSHVAKIVMKKKDS